MLAQIIAHTPAWVWWLLLALLWLGYSQTRARQVGLPRLLLLPLAMTGLSLSGTLSSLGLSARLLLVWFIAWAVTAWLLARRPAPAAARYDPHTGLFQLPGSWAPLALILGIFCIKYAVGATLAINPDLARGAEFAVAVATIYGALGGVFIARAVRLWRLSRLQPVSS